MCHYSLPCAHHCNRTCVFGIDLFALLLPHVQHMCQKESDMSRREIMPSAAILCVVLSVVNCNVVTVLIRRLKEDPEVPCALALIPPLFELGENNSAMYTHAPRLYVFGETGWINAFLRQFPSVAAIYLFSGAEILPKFGDFITAGMMPSATVVLLCADASRFLEHFPYRVRVVEWETSVSLLSAERIKRLEEGEVPRPGICHRFVRLMITAQHARSTHVFAATTSCDQSDPEPKRSYKLLGVWSLGTGWSSPGLSLFPPPCISWRPPPDVQPLLAEMLGYELEKYDSNNPLMVEYFKTTRAYEVLRLLRHYIGSVFETSFNFTTDTVAYPLRAAEVCHLDLKACSIVNDPLDVRLHTELSVFPWQLDALVCVVPAGAGKPYHIFYPITAEFTPVVWTGLAVAVIAMVACLCLMRRDKSVQHMVFLTITPLLAQPLGKGQARWQLSLLGTWLLTCIVVVAAYQGQLLSLIRNPPDSREINSWQEWVESDLVMMVSHQFEFVAGPDGDFPGLTKERLQVTVPSLKAMMKEILTHRNYSFLVYKYRLETIMRNASQKLRSKIHTFEMNTLREPSTCFATTKRSPLEVPLRKVLGRIRAAGGLPDRRYYNNSELEQIAEKEAQKRAQKVDQGRNEERAIAIRHLKPVILIYIIGNLSACLSFSMEVSKPLIGKFVLMAKRNLNRTFIFLLILSLVCSSTTGLLTVFLLTL